MPRALPKADALSALAELRAALLDPAQEITGLLRRQMAASVDYAMERIGAIEELKRARKTPRGGLADTAGSTTANGGGAE